MRRARRDRGKSVGEELRRIIHRQHQHSERSAPQEGGAGIGFPARRVQPVIGRHEPLHRCFPCVRHLIDNEASETGTLGVSDAQLNPKS